MTPKILIRTLFLLAAISATSLCRQDPSIREADRIRLAEAFRIYERLGTRIWKSWDDAPFALLLVTSDHEFLFRHPKPSDDFSLLHYDSLLQTDVYVRARQFPTGLLATFPAVGGISTIVIGQPENTDAHQSNRWVLTVLHEHFHQLQQSRPEYYGNVQKLDLSGGDQTGMWMLNYPFPYDSTDISRQFALSGRKLRETVTSPKPEFVLHYGAFREFRDELKALLNSRDYSYMSFQLWQEGIARYTELTLARLLIDGYTPSEDFRALDDYVPFREVNKELRALTVRALGNLAGLSESRRVAFYPFGAVEGLLLDRVNPNWRERYFSEPFFLERYYPSAK